ncbi:VOC family protein [Aeromicrobium sp. CF4.19]|uniref:VOC family protein n=1 Tax=Aeromicrobium sp. CF4.19 TaxID=3373082 RepID=UPI003EE5C8BA
MDIVIHFAFLPHLDAEESLIFYRDVLGFEVRKDVGGGEHRWLTVGPPAQPQTSVVLHPPTADPTLSEDEQRTILELIAKGSYGAITLATHDLDAAFERIEAAGAEVLQEPADLGYGVRDCAFRDPAGNLVRMNQL